jgi:hypothetical protein
MTFEDLIDDPYDEWQINMLLIDMKIFYVYYLRRPDKIDPLDGSKAAPFYVGKGHNNRLYEHRYEAFGKLHKSGRKSYKVSVIHALWKKGIDFIEEIMFSDLTEQEAFDFEKEMIKTYGRKNIDTGILTNMTDGGEGNFGYVSTEETREKLKIVATGKIKTEEHRRNLSIANTGKKHTPESIQKMSETHKNLPPPSEEARKNMSDAHRGILCKEETKQKISIANKGKVRTDECRQLLSETHKGKITWMKGKIGIFVHDKETRKVISDASKQMWESEEHRNNISEKQKESWQNEERRESFSKSMKKVWERDGYRENISEKQKQAWKIRKRKKSIRISY